MGYLYNDAELLGGRARARLANPRQPLRTLARPPARLMAATVVEPTTQLPANKKNLTNECLLTALGRGSKVAGCQAQPGAADGPANAPPATVVTINAGTLPQASLTCAGCQTWSTRATPACGHLQYLQHAINQRPRPGWEPLCDRCHRRDVSHPPTQSPPPPMLIIITPQPAPTQPATPCAARHRRTTPAAPPRQLCCRRPCRPCRRLRCWGWWTATPAAAAAPAS